MELWGARLERPLTEAETEWLLQELPPERRERLLRLRVKEKWREPLCAYRLLQRILQNRYGWERLPEVAVTDEGKPWFPDHPHVRFSISHTEGAVLVGVAEQPVGVDIERIRLVRQGLLERFSVQDEEAFFSLWVRREARGKCSGEGIGPMLREELPLQENERYFELETFPGYAAGVAGIGIDVPPTLSLISLEDLLT